MTEDSMRSEADEDEEGGRRVSAMARVKMRERVRR